MFSHCTMINESKEVPFVIIDQEAIPFGYPNAGLYRHLELTNQGAHCPDCGFWTTKVHEYHPKRGIAGSQYPDHRSFHPSPICM